MTDRIKGLIITLDSDIREDDVKPIIDAIGQIRHIQDVRPVVADHNDLMNRVRVKGELAQKFFELLRE